MAMVADEEQCIKLLINPKSNDQIIEAVNYLRNSIIQASSVTNIVDNTLPELIKIFHSYEKHELFAEILSLFVYIAQKMPGVLSFSTVRNFAEKTNQLFVSVIQSAAYNHTIKLNAIQALNSTCRAGNSYNRDLEIPRKELIESLLPLFDQTENDEVGETLRETITDFLGNLLMLKSDRTFEYTAPIFRHMLNEMVQVKYPGSVTNVLTLLQKAVPPNPDYTIPYLLENFHFVEKLTSFIPDPCSQRRREVHFILFSFLTADERPDSVKLADLILNRTNYLDGISQVLSTPELHSVDVSDVSRSLVRLIKSTANIDSLADHPCFARFFELVKSKDDDIEAEALSILVEMANHESSYARAKLLEYGIIALFFEYLRFNSTSWLCLAGLENLLKQAEKEVDNEEIIYNPVAIKISECGALEQLQKSSASNIIKLYFGPKYEEFLSKRRGLNTKKAN